MSTQKLANTFKNVFEHKFLWSFIDFFCFYIRNSLEKQTENSGVLLNWINLCPGQPMPCEGNWVVSPRCWQDIDLHSVYIIAEMGFSASCNSTIYTLYTAWYQLRQRNNSNENHAVITLKNFNTKDNLTQLSSKAHK